MKKKLILTESQYNRLQEFLFENKFDNIVAKLEQTKGLDFEEKRVEDLTTSITEGLYLKVPKP